MVRKQGFWFLCSLNPVLLGMEWGSTMVSRGFVASSCAPGPAAASVGHQGWAALGGGEHLWEIYSPT